MYCKNCGHETDGKFCPECGTKLEVDDISTLVDEFDRSCSIAHPNKNINNSNEVTKKQLRRWLPVFISIFLLCIAFIVVSCCDDTKYNSIISSTYKSATKETIEAKTIYDYSYDEKKYYYELTTKELYEDYEYYEDEYITTTIKVTDIDSYEDENYYYYYYTVYDLDGYSDVTISATIYTNEKVNIGDYITVSGLCNVYEYGDWLEIEIEVDGIIETDKNLFKSLGSETKPTEAKTKSTIKPTEKVAEKPKPISYTEGHYKVGADIPAGTYIAYPIDDWGGYYCVSSDSNGDDIIANQNFDGQDYFTVTNGQYLELSNCRAYTLNNKRAIDTSDGYLHEGEYLVGTDISAGEYKIYSNDDWGGYYALNSDANGEDIISNDNFDNSRYITITSGYYLELSNCKMKIN